MPLLAKLPGGALGVEHLLLTLPPLPARWHLRFGAPIDPSGAPSDPHADLSWVEAKNLEATPSSRCSRTCWLLARASFSREALPQRGFRRTPGSDPTPWPVELRLARRRTRQGRPSSLQGRHARRQPHGYPQVVKGEGVPLDELAHLLSHHRRALQVDSSGRMRPSSSPPYRAKTSSRRVRFRMSEAACLSTASPARCPWNSVPSICLKKSMSRASPGDSARARSGGSERARAPAPLRSSAG